MSTGTRRSRSARPSSRYFLAIIGVLALLSSGAARAGILTTPLRATDLDDTTFTQFVDGTEKPVVLADGPRNVLWTQDSAPGDDGVFFGESDHPGPRSLRIGFQSPIPVGSVLVRGGGRLSVLDPRVPYPGNPGSDADWIPAYRIVDNRVSQDEVGDNEYAIWVLPRRISTRAIRFTHTAAPAERTFRGWLGGVDVLTDRLANVGPQATVFASADNKAAPQLTDRTTNGGQYLSPFGPEAEKSTWIAGGDEPAERISAQHPVWIVLEWPQPARLVGLAGIGASFGAAEIQVYTGPAHRRPREARAGDWTTVQSFTDLPAPPGTALPTTWLELEGEISTRAVRLRITRPAEPQSTNTVTTDPSTGPTTGAASTEKAAAPGIVSLIELMALEPIKSDPLDSALIKPLQFPHPPIPVRFNLKEPAIVSLVIEDQNSRRIAGLVSETPSHAGENTYWWSGLDDSGHSVPPGTYRVRGLFHPPLGLHRGMGVYTHGDPPWNNPRGDGGWLTDVHPPSAVVFVPGDHSPDGKPEIWIGSPLEQKTYWFPTRPGITRTGITRTGITYPLSEETDCLVRADLQGRKIGGQRNFGLSGRGADFLARDSGPNAAAGVYAYAVSGGGSLLLTPLRAGLSPSLTWLGITGQKQLTVGGLAVYNGLAAVSLTNLNQILFLDAARGDALGSAPLVDPGALAVDPQGRLLAISGRQLVRMPMPGLGVTPAPPRRVPEYLTLPRDTLLSLDNLLPVTLLPEVIVGAGLEDPRGIALDRDGNIYISDRGNSQQIKVFTDRGQWLRSIGEPGPPAAGPYNPNHLNNPDGLAITDNGRLWVAESDEAPRRVSVWSLDGKLMDAFYGPPEFGGSGCLDPRDRTRFYYTGRDGLELKLDWATGASRPVDVYFRRENDSLRLPTGPDGPAPPETPIYFNDREYLTDAYDSRSRTGAGIAVIWLLENGLARPVAALGTASDWKVEDHSLFSEPAYALRFPAGVDLKTGPVIFAWSDLNGDGQMEPDEVSFAEGTAGDVTVLGDLSFVTGSARMYKPVRFTAQGAPVYDVGSGQELVPGARPLRSAEGGQVLPGKDGWTFLTQAPEPFPLADFVAGAHDGVPIWGYHTYWAGGHNGSHPLEYSDELSAANGPVRLLGLPVTSSVGEIVAVGGGEGTIRLFTMDGHIIGTILSSDYGWDVPTAQPGMYIPEDRPGEYSLWTSITQTTDGKVYLVVSPHSSCYLVRIDGLDEIRRLPDSTLQVTADSLAACRQYFLAIHALQMQEDDRWMVGQECAPLVVPIRNTAPVVDGKLGDWPGVTWALISSQPIPKGAHPTSDINPAQGTHPTSDTSPAQGTYSFPALTAAVMIAGDRLYAAFHTGDPDLIVNGATAVQDLYRGGGALDLEIGADPTADRGRNHAVAGDERLLVALVGGKPTAVLYRPVSPGAGPPVSLGTPWNPVLFDQVENLSRDLQFAESDGDYEFSLPLADLGLKPKPGEIIQGDLGYLEGDGARTLRHHYWNSRFRESDADASMEALVNPQDWRDWVIGQ